jgi:hypothetical protein
MLKIPTVAWNLPLSAKLLVISHPQFPYSLLEVSRIVVDVGASGGASGSFQSRVRTISLHGCGTSGGDSLCGPTEEEELTNTSCFLFTASFIDLYLKIQFWDIKLYHQVGVDCNVLHEC